MYFIYMYLKCHENDLNFLILIREFKLWMKIF